MTRIKLTIEYDGTAYCGWQRQENAIAIQERIEDSIFLATGERVTVHASGRTDAGVHSLGQIAHFDTNCTIPPNKIMYAVNAYLPSDISIKSSEQVEDSFHARFSAKKKTYRYNVYSSDTPSPLCRHTAAFVRGSLCLESMVEASKHFIGRKDFAAFSASGSSAKTTVREIFDIRIIKNQSLYSFYITGGGFLYNMVRIIVGTLVYVGKGKINVCDIPNIISSLERTLAGPTMPPNGLCLYSVEYNN